MLSGLAELVPSSSSRASEFWNLQHEPHASLFCHISVWTLLCHTIRNRESPGITSHAQLGWCPSWERCVFSSPGVLGGCRGLVLLIFVSLSSVSQSAGCFPGKTGSDFLSSVEAGRWQRILKKKSLSVCEKEQRRHSQLKKQSESLTLTSRGERWTTLTC